MHKPNAAPTSPATPTRVRLHRGKEYPVSAAHPVTDCYPWMTESQLGALASSIRKNGQKEPIRRLADGRIIDGRNRELACLVAGVEPRYEQSDLTDLAAIISYIRTANDDRRHSSASQRAMTAARLVTLVRGSNQHKPKVDGAQAPSTSQGEIAEQFRVSRDLIKRALVVLRHGVEGLAAAVDDDRLDVTTAARVARLSSAEQQAVAASVNPKAAALWAFLPRPAPPAPTSLSPLVPDGDTFIRVEPRSLTVGGVNLDGRGTVLPGIPKRLADGRVWMGWYIDIRRGVRTAYLIPAPQGGWFVVVMNGIPDEWHTHRYPLAPHAAMARLTHHDHFDFDAWAAYWQPTTRFAPSAVNPLYTEPDYAPTLSPELKRLVADEMRREEERQGLVTSSPGGEDVLSEIPF